jgi:hypothetical protein
MTMTNINKYGNNHFLIRGGGWDFYIIVQEVGWKNSRDNNQCQDTDKTMHFTFYVK